MGNGVFDKRVDGKSVALTFISNIVFSLDCLPQLDHGSFLLFSPASCPASSTSSSTTSS